MAIVVSHPTQYYCPWFTHLAQNLEAELRVFYLWDFGMTKKNDPNFRQSVKWDISLVEGHDHEFVENIAEEPGTSHFSGLDNPSLFEQLEHWRPTCILAFGYGWKSLLKLGRNWRDCPIILRGDTHDLVPPSGHFLKRWIRRVFLKNLFRKYDRFAAVGEANRQFYLNHGVTSAQISPIPHCVDNERFANTTVEEQKKWRREHVIPEDKILLLFAGKFEPKKCPIMLAKAFTEIKIDFIHLAFLGNGKLVDQLRAVVDGYDNISLLPFHNQMAMPKALAAADILVLPSYGHQETWGLIVNEAMAAGTPAIVSSHVGCATDLITTDQTGWIFPAGDKHALCATIKHAVENLQSNRTKIEAQVRQRIDRYSYRVATTQVQVMLSRLMNPS